MFLELHAGCGLSLTNLHSSHHHMVSEGEAVSPPPEPATATMSTTATPKTQTQQQQQQQQQQPQPTATTTDTVDAQHYTDSPPHLPSSETGVTFPPPQRGYKKNGAKVKADGVVAQELRRALTRCGEHSRGCEHPIKTPRRAMMIILPPLPNLTFMNGNSTPSPNATPYAE